MKYSVDSPNWIIEAIAGLKNWADTNLQIHLSKLVERISESQKFRALSEPTPSIVLQIIRSDEERSSHNVTLCIGYPFPIYTEKYPGFNPSYEGLEIFVHYHKLQLQDSLRANFVTNLEKTQQIILKEVNENQFKDNVKRCFALRYSLFLFNDPYHYIGDSVSSLRNFEAFSPFIQHENLIFTTCNKPMEGYRGFKYYDADSLMAKLGDIQKNSSVFALLPLYIDDQWKLVTSISVKLLETVNSVVIAIPGCNILIIKVLDNKPIVYHLTEKDVSLWDFPNEEMIMEAVSKFVPILEVPRPSPVINKQGTIILNPFSSTRIKDLPTILIHRLNSQLQKNESKTIICAGFRSNSYHNQWIEHLQSISDSSIENLFFLHSLTDIADKISLASMIITADTSTAHIAERLGIPSIVIYNSYVWDNSSWASLMHHSPLGFCNNFYYQVPMLCSVDMFHGQISDDATLSILGCVHYLLNSGTSIQSHLYKFIIQNGKLLDYYLNKISNQNDAYILEIIHYFQGLLNNKLNKTDQWLIQWLKIDAICPVILSNETPVLHRIKLIKKFIEIHPLYKAYNILNRLF